MSDKISREERTDASGDSKFTRRGMMALTGLAGLGIASTGMASAAQSGDLDMNGYQILNVNDIKAASNTAYSSWMSSGSGSGAVQLWDKSAGTYFLRAQEDGSGSAGPINVNSSIEDGLDVDNLSISGWNVVDLVEKGADPSGGTSINSLLDQYAGDNTLIVLPDGEYKMDGPFNHDQFTNFGLVGKGDAILKATGNITTPLLGFGYTDDTKTRETLRLENLTIDITNSGCRPLFCLAEKNMLVENVEVVGKRQDGVGNIDSNIFGMTASDGYGRVNIRLPDGGEYRSGKSRTSQFIGVAAGGGRNVGTLVFDGCYLANFLNNGLYLKAHPGQVYVKNCHVKNCGLTSIRLGDGHSARDCLIEIDDEAAKSNTNVPSSSDFNPAAQAIWGELGNTVYENITIVRNNGGNRLIRNGTDADAFMRCSNLNVEDSGTGDVFELVYDGEIVMENCVFEKKAGSSWTSQVESPNARVTMRDCKYTTTKDSTNRRGILVRDSERFVAENCYFDAQNYTLQPVDNRSSAEMYTRIVGCEVNGRLNIKGPKVAVVKDCDFSNGNLTFGEHADTEFVRDNYSA
ncbi:MULTISPECIES: hypothetical protein [unclassified Haladaptatus]|uniref:hypothetical protein n=1 Tax=unclassified Haladaptatus TaxID=2622732 RepID=UPI00209C2EF8|nr:MULTISPECIES: hypothetical protein [unclassified Haladaptatus]MCO8246424.1 hypothetical protein [Haladaptatus sp. AB643]MCO8254661.1 hypothetical protein [Haladaptatus sp. AB618]